MAHVAIYTYCMKTKDIVALIEDRSSRYYHLPLLGMSFDTSYGLETNVIHCGCKLEVPNGELSCDAVPAIHMSTSYLFNSSQSLLDVSKGADGFVYRRYGNQNSKEIETALMQLECAKFGVCVSSGMAAVSTSLITAGVLKGGKKVLAPFSCYGSTYSLLKKHFADIAHCQFVDMANIEEVIEQIRALQPDILYMETSSNPLTVVADLGRFAAEAKSCNSNAISIVDNTFATPLNVKPIALGVDIVLHSLTKYINGHGDVLGGAILTNRDDLYNAAVTTAIDFGPVLSPWDSWLILRGLRTLVVRMNSISDNAIRVARHLSSHRHVSRVLYPGLPSHPQFQIVKRVIGRKLSADEEANGFPFSGMVTFELRVPSDSFEYAKIFIDSLKLVSNQVSLGDVKTLASCPALSTQHQVSAIDRLRTGLTSGTIRMSVGMEDISDICSDIDQALEKMILGNDITRGLLSSTDVTVASETVDEVSIAKGHVAADETPSDGVAGVRMSEKFLRLKQLAIQMDSLNREMEQIQQSIRSENRQLLNSLSKL